jgi:hypothetical protein
MDEVSQSDTAAPRSSTGRAVLHTLTALVIGLGAAHFTHAATVMALLTGVPGLVAVLVVGVVTGVALAAAAVAGTGKRGGAWLGLTALVVVPAVLVAEVVLGMVSALGGGSGTVDLSPTPLPYVVGAVLAAVPALLVHPGRPRALGLVFVAAGVVALIVVAVVLGPHSR